ncbi:MAG: hypothetical protein WBI55_04455 [Eubacteriales bacterium]|jgi:hypothetical protein
MKRGGIRKDFADEPCYFISRKRCDYGGAAPIIPTKGAIPLWNPNKNGIAKQKPSYL